MLFLFLNAIVASLDGLIIGIGLRFSNIELSKKNIFIIFIENILIYTFFLFLYKYFHFTFMTKNITTLLYLFLAWNSFHNEDSIEIKEQKLNFITCSFITLTHSLDGTIVSLSFAYNYALLYICCIFSILSVLILLIGYYFAKQFKNCKKGNYLSTILFVILALINHFL